MDIQKNQTQESFEKLYVKNAPDWSLERDPDDGYKYHATQSAFLLFEQQQVEIDLLKAELAKAQAVPEVITIGNELQSWVAVWSFSAKNDGEDYVVVDANLLAEKIEGLTGASQ